VFASFLGSSEVMRGTSGIVPSDNTMGWASPRSIPTSTPRLTGTIAISCSDASVLALLGITLASEYLFPSGEDRFAESTPYDRSAGRAVVADGRGHRATTPSEIPARRVVARGADKEDRAAA